MFRERALYIVALLRKMICNLRHPMPLRHFVREFAHTHRYSPLCVLARAPHTRTHTHTEAHTSMCVCMQTTHTGTRHTFANASARARTHTQRYTLSHTRARARTHIHTGTYWCAYVCVQTHTHTHTGARHMFAHARAHTPARTNQSGMFPYRYIDFIKVFYLSASTDI